MILSNWVTTNKCHFRFIAQNVDGLFGERYVKSDGISVGKARTTSSQQHQEDWKVCGLPPMETFFPHLDPERRVLHFFELVQPGDVLLCRVGAMNAAGLLLKVLCFHPDCGKSRLLHDLRLKCFCPTTETVPTTETGRRWDELPSSFLMLMNYNKFFMTLLNYFRNYDKEDMVTTVVLEVRRDSQRLLVSMKTPEDIALPSGVRLGSTPFSARCPAPYAASLKAEKEDLSYAECLEGATGFANPSCVENLAVELGLPVTAAGCSLFDSLRKGHDPEEGAVALRKRQSAKWALGHVASGIRYFKAGNNVEAFQCLNQALKIDPDNVEGLVARGALYANGGSLEKAVTDFGQALDRDPAHKNARKYMCETLVALSRNIEDEGKYEEAIASYRKILAVEADHKEALESIRYLTRKTQGMQQQAEMKDKIDLLIKSDKNRKKRRRSWSSASSSSSSSSGSSSSSTSSSDGRSRKGKKKSRAKSKKKKKSDSKERKRSSENRSPSPFSKRLQPEAGLGFNPTSAATPSVVKPIPTADNPVHPTAGLAVLDAEAPPPGEEGIVVPRPAAVAKPPIASYPPPHQIPSMASGGVHVPPPYGYGGPPPPFLLQQQASKHEDAYDKAVKEFLERTNQGSDRNASRSRRSRSERDRGSRAP